MSTTEKEKARDHYKHNQLPSKNLKGRNQMPTCDVSTKLLTLDEAIDHAEECADGSICGQNHKQLAEWLKELDRLRTTPLGNIIALRQALVKAHTMLKVCDWPEGVYMKGVADLMKEIESAIYASARNYDVGTLTRRKDIKREVEYAIQIRTRDRYKDYSVYNRRTCRWETPIEDWAAIITDNEYKRCCESHRSARLVKRVTTEEVICRGRPTEGGAR